MNSWQLTSTHNLNDSFSAVKKKHHRRISSNNWGDEIDDQDRIFLHEKEKN